MNKFLMLFALISFTFSSCETNKENKVEVEVDNQEETNDLPDNFNAPKLVEVPALNKCYRYKGDNLNAEMNLELDNDDVVTGTLSYNGSVNQKGNVIGEFEGDTLILTYKYLENDAPISTQIYLLKDDENQTFQMSNNQKETDLVFNGLLFQKYDCQQIE